MQTLWLAMMAGHGSARGAGDGPPPQCTARGVRHEYEYCDVCVNRSDDNMLDVCFQDSQLTSIPRPLHNSATKEIEKLPIKLINDERDMFVAGYKSAQIPSLERKQRTRRTTSLKLCNMKLDYTSRLMNVNTCAGTCQSSLYRSNTD